MNTTPPIALVTGATQGLGRALAVALAARGWRLVVTARTPDDLALLAGELSRTTDFIPLAGDVGDPEHRDEVARVVADRAGGRLDLLVNNASTLGPTPLHSLQDLDAADLAAVLHTNVVAPHALTRALAPALVAAGGVLVGISSDAGVEHYETWGGYGASKAALDHLTLTWGAETPSVRAYAFDPGDMRTAMHQAAFPGEDISDRPLPEEVAVPALLRLVTERPPSGRYRAADVLAEQAVAR